MLNEFTYEIARITVYVIMRNKLRDRARSSRVLRVWRHQAGMTSRSLHGVLLGPLLGHLHVLSVVALEDARDLGHQRVVGVGVAQERADGQQNCWKENIKIKLFEYIEWCVKKYFANKTLELKKNCWKENVCDKIKLFEYIKWCVKKYFCEQNTVEKELLENINFWVKNLKHSARTEPLTGLNRETARSG